MMHELGTPWECKHCGRKFSTRIGMYSHSGRCLRKKRHQVEVVTGFTVSGFSTRYLVMPLIASCKRFLASCVEDIRMSPEEDTERKDDTLHNALWVMSKKGNLTFTEISQEEYDKKSLTCKGLSIESKWAQEP